MQATADQDFADVLLLPREIGKTQISAPSAYIVGTKGTGKSTLMEVLMWEYLQRWKDCWCLIVDTKPRFRAERELNGFSTNLSRRYRMWGYGSGIIPGSVTLPGRMSPKQELDTARKAGYRIIIAQAEDKSGWDWVAKVAETFYSQYGAKRPRLIVVDELADFFELRSAGQIIQRIARNGRERDVALIAGSQRPRKVPKEIMTEMRRLYLFELQWVGGSNSDLGHVMEFGIPADVEVPQGHVFYAWDRVLKRSFPSHAYHVLDLSTNYWTGEPY